MTKQKINYLLTTAVYFIITVAAFAQDDMSDEGPEGPPPAPINNYLLLLAIVGIVFAWRTFKHKSAIRVKAKQLKTTP